MVDEIWDDAVRAVLSSARSWRVDTAMSRYAYHQLDGNHRAIVAVFAAHGLRWEPLGRPVDGMIGYAGRNYLIEIKSPKGKLRPSQERFLARWAGQCALVRSVEEALSFVRYVKGV